MEMLLSIPNIKVTQKFLHPLVGPPSLPSSSITHFDCSRFHCCPSLIPLFFRSLVCHLSLSLELQNLHWHHTTMWWPGRLNPSPCASRLGTYICNLTTNVDIATYLFIYHTFITSQIAVGTLYGNGINLTN